MTDEHPTFDDALRSFRLTSRDRSRATVKEGDACAEFAALAGQRVDLEYVETIENVDGETIAEQKRTEQANLCHPFTSLGPWPHPDELDSALEELTGDGPDSPAPPDPPAPS